MYERHLGFYKEALHRGSSCGCFGFSQSPLPPHQPSPTYLLPTRLHTTYLPTYPLPTHQPTHYLPTHLPTTYPAVLRQLHKEFFMQYVIVPTSKPLPLLQVVDHQHLTPSLHLSVMISNQPTSPLPFSFLYTTSFVAIIRLALHPGLQIDLRPLHAGWLLTPRYRQLEDESATIRLTSCLLKLARLGEKMEKME